ncbi:Pattern recognition serine proteinase [Operophtera brumata]|uniref:Pattern recognition serine proteinase n=1 Tax=Operophtera brumata TaxID=104452 RepID=A0A0L7KWD9_OPEBR|nr:Pattern recognition serine proteinase [Operophtera brumata]
MHLNPAAHCFWTDLEKQLPASMFAVAVGKLYRPWNDTKDQAQESQVLVKIIHLPRRYQGTSANFQDDIAVVIVAREFQFKTHIRPVCLSFDYHFEQQQLYTGNKGKVAGWGLTAADGKASPVLQVVDLPYVDVGTCINKSPPDYRDDKICAGGTLERHYITSDKICARTLEPNSALCRGDSGGGLVFPERVAGVERYYLRGVVSTAPSSDRACNTAPYTSFTALSKHEPFIKQYWIESTYIDRERYYLRGVVSTAPSSDRAFNTAPYTSFTALSKLEPFIKQYWIESGEFKCQDGSVITVAKHCDGARDCADGSDETEHACAKTPCSDYLFRCAYGACVDRGATCDGHCDGARDCADGSDETEHVCARAPCSDYLFWCAYGATAPLRPASSHPTPVHAVRVLAPQARTRGPRPRTPRTRLVRVLAPHAHTRGPRPLTPRPQIAC